MVIPRFKSRAEPNDIKRRAERMGNGHLSDKNDLVIINGDLADRDSFAWKTGERVSCLYAEPMDRWGV